MKLFALFFVVGLLACEVSKPRNTSENLCEGREALSLQFADLIHHKAKYHGKLIEVKGYCEFGFERSRLRLDTLPLTWSPDVDYLSYYSALWLEFGPSVHYTEWSRFNRKFVSIKGVYDTSRYGHLGSYFAEISDICEISEAASMAN